jgi:hypothetical protein
LSCLSPDAVLSNIENMFSNIFQDRMIIGFSRHF